MNGLTLALILAQLAIVFGATSYSPIQIKQEYGHDVRYCQMGDVQMMPGSFVKDLNTCMECTCTKDGLDCQTMKKAFTITAVDNPDSKCESVRIGCKNRWVRKNNNSKFCSKKNIPQILSMVGK